MAAVETNVTELPESRVRVETVVPAEEVERRLRQTASALGRQMRIPGFRKGKVPPPVIIKRLGREAVLDETLRESLGRWYADAIASSGIVPVGDPSLDVGDLPGTGEPLTFSIEIGVRPKATLGEVEGLEVGRREPEVADDAVEHELEALREQLGKLETVDASAQDDDFVVIDYVGRVDGEAFEGGEGRDQLVQLGSGRLVDTFEEQLAGAAAGDERTVTITFPDDYGAEHLAGKAAEFEVAVKEVRRKALPELDDDFAADAAGFDTLDELREDIRAKLLESEQNAIEAEFREAVFEAVVRAAEVDVPDALVEARADELFDEMIHALSHRGIAKETYLQISGKTEDELKQQARPEARQGLERDAVLAALVEARAIEPSDEQILEALEPSAEREGTSASKLLERLRSSGRIDAVRRDLAAREAIDALVAEATPITIEQAKARDLLWTPEKAEREAAAEAGGGTVGGRLWTPDS